MSKQSPVIFICSVLSAALIFINSSEAIAGTDFDPETGIREFEGCVYNKANGRKIAGAQINIWAPGGGGHSSTTDEDGCFSGGGIGYPAASGGFIEASAIIKGRHVRQQYLLPPSLSINAGVDYHYDFFLDAGVPAKSSNK